LVKNCAFSYLIFSRGKGTGSVLE